MNLNTLNKSLNKGQELKNHYKKLLSEYRNYLPMYDIYSGKIILVKNTELFNKMKSNHFRFIDKRLFRWLQNKLKKDKNNIDLKNGINFLNNYDLNKLYKNSIETM